jgi:hypothetical protein
MYILYIKNFITLTFLSIFIYELVDIITLKTYPLYIYNNVFVMLISFSNIVFFLSIKKKDIIEVKEFSFIENLGNVIDNIINK